MKQQNLQRTGILALMLLAFNFSFIQAQPKARNTILLRTGWDSETFGEMASIPALYRAIQRYVPETEVIIWPYEMTDELKALLEKSFTQLNLVEGEINENGEPSTMELKEAFESSDLLLYAAGVQGSIDWTGQNRDGFETASLRYCRKMEIPYVVYGLGVVPENPEAQAGFQEILNGATLSFIMESRSGDRIKDYKLKIDNLKDGPNPLFAFDLKNDTGARNYIEASGIVDHDFIVFNFKNSGQPESEDPPSMKKILFILDHWVESTDHLILLLADSREDIGQMKQIYEKLPEAVKSRTIVYDDVYSPDLISSVVEKSRISVAMSPYPLFPALLADIPIYHLADWNINTDGQIFVDLGLKDFVMDINHSSEKELLEGLTDINKSYVKALIETNKSHNEVIKELQGSFEEIHKILTRINPVPKEKKEKKNKE